MRILGVSSFDHDTSAALMEDGVITAAIENDKLTRSPTRGLPEAAIRFCLRTCHLEWSDVDMVAAATHPMKRWLRRSKLRVKLSLSAPVASGYYGVNEVWALAKGLNDLRVLRRSSADCRSKVVNFDEHICHAAHAFFASPFERALIVVLDEDGDGNSGLLAIGEGARIRVLQRIAFPHSPAWVYSQVTNLLGFSPHREEHKTQWLSLEGEPIYKELFLRLLCRSNKSFPDLDYSFFNRGLAGRLPFSEKFYREIRTSSSRPELSDDQRRDLARSIQDACSELVTALVESFRKQEKVTYVCLAGGLFQNSLLVAAVERALGLDTTFVPPAPGDAGTAYGAAYLAWHHALRRPRTNPVHDIYRGPTFDHQQTKDVLDNCKARYSFQNTQGRRIDATVQLLQAGKIVGWFQGRAEFGPRALGNRSILASPWAPYVHENLNDYIKHREGFRPFAISVPEEDCPRYFEASQQCRFMNSLGRVRPHHGLPASFVLPDGRVRLHVVEKRSNPLFWQLLKRFGEQAPAPMLLNTSFNLFGEPLVVTPRDAVRSYFCSGLDALVIDLFVLSKTTIPTAVPLYGKNEIRAGA